MKTYQAIELGRSLRGAKELVPKLVVKWKIDEDWFWNGHKGAPYAPNATLKDISKPVLTQMPVQTPVLTSTKQGQIVLVVEFAEEFDLLFIPETFAFPVVNDDNAPRFRSGNQLIVCKPDRYPDGCWVACAHLTRSAIAPDGKPYALVYIRWYHYDTDRYTLTPRNPEAEVFDITQVRLLGRVVENIKTHGPGWTTSEKSPDGLPYEEPR